MSKQDTKAIMARVEMIEAEAAKLRALIQEQEKPQGLWRPGESDTHYWLSGCDLGVERGYGEDECAVKSGNCFPTRESAEKAAPLFARAHKIIQAALMADPEAGGFIRDDRAHTVYFDMDENKWTAVRMHWSDHGSAYVHTSAQAEHMAARLNAEGV